MPEWHRSRGSGLPNFDFPSETFRVSPVLLDLSPRLGLTWTPIVRASRFLTPGQPSGSFSSGTQPHCGRRCGATNRPMFFVQSHTRTEIPALPTNPCLKLRNHRPESALNLMEQVSARYPLANSRHVCLLSARLQWWEGSEHIETNSAHRPLWGTSIRSGNIARHPTRFSRRDRDAHLVMVQTRRMDIRLWRREARRARTI